MYQYIQIWFTPSPDFIICMEDTPYGGGALANVHSVQFHSSLGEL